MRACLKSLFSLLLAISVLTATYLSTNAATVYVNASATGANNGSSWADAYTNLQSALIPAVPGTSIWVAAGTYKPGSDSTWSFRLKNGVGIYGGFVGNETALSQRNWAANCAVLSGDVGIVGDSNDNCFCVIKGGDKDSTAVLDGFYVSGGKARGAYPNGGGMYSGPNGNATLANILFSSNSATGNGGGMYNGSPSNPSLTNVYFTANLAGSSGGGMYNAESSSPRLTNVSFNTNSALGGHGGGMGNEGLCNPKLTNVMFHGNFAAVNGGGMSNLGANPTLINVVFSANWSSGTGGGMYNFWSGPTLLNVSFSGNQATNVGGAMANWQNSTPTLTNTIMWGDSAITASEIYNYTPGLTTISYSLVRGSGGSGGWNTAFGIDGGGNIDANPKFVNESSGDVHLTLESPAMNAGNTAALPYGVTTDVDGNARVSGAAIDMGAYELDLGLVIQSITDVGNDQGGHVRIGFTASAFDVRNSPYPILQYEAFRRNDPLALSALGAPDASKMNSGDVKSGGEVPQMSPLMPGWEFVGAIPAHGESEYLLVAPTLADSTITDGMHWSVFFIRAATATPVVYYDSVADSGYSLDNLAPNVPSGFSVAYNSGSGNGLAWEPSEDADFRYFRVYRATSSNFVPGPGNMVHMTIAGEWIDPVENGYQYYYKITAVDFSGNESDPASPGEVTGITGSVIPKTPALYVNVPNPFNPSTAIRYDVPSPGGMVAITVYDVSGRLIRALVERAETPGEKRAAWDGRNDQGEEVSSGVYFCRMTLGSFTQAHKMVLTR